jgi:uncharacterized protein
MKIDLFEFARQGGEASGALALIEMPRVETPDRSGSMAWKAAGSAGTRHGSLQLDLDVDGTVELICQRCLMPMAHALSIRSHFVIVRDEAAAAALDDDDNYDAIIGAPDFELDTLIEDEVLLALPIAPRHDVCPGEQDRAPAASGRSSPFAALAALKTGSAERPPKKS